MGIIRNELAEPQWGDYDYAKVCKLGVFSRESWNRTVEWKVLLEHAMRTKGLCHLMFENTYPSRLFMANIELLEANLYVFGDLFYWLTGLNANTLDYGLLDEALSYVFFWNMNCHKDIHQVVCELEELESLFIECLKQGSLCDDLKENPMWKSDNCASHIRSRLDASISWTEEKGFARHYAFEYVRKKYELLKADEEGLMHSIIKILQLIQFFCILLGACGNGYYHDFDSLLSSFRKSEKVRRRYLKPWERYFHDTRESLIEKMRNNPDLAPWVDRYISLEGDSNVIGRLFCKEFGDNMFLFFKKGKEEEYYNTDNWICLLTIAAVLQEYDEQHALPVEKPARKTKAPCPFTDFIIDTPKSEAVLKRLHEIIDGKKPKRCALTIIAAVQSGILMQPTYKALFSEFPEIGDRKNYEYYLQRKNNYSDDINSIAKGF